eukprot:752138-Hanusia_phi.AAC.1
MAPTLVAETVRLSSITRFESGLPVDSEPPGPRAPMGNGYGYEGDEQRAISGSDHGKESERDIREERREERGEELRGEDGMGKERNRKSQSKRKETETQRLKGAIEKAKCTANRLDCFNQVRYCLLFVHSIVCKLQLVVGLIVDAQKLFATNSLEAISKHIKLNQTYPWGTDS